MLQPVMQQCILSNGIACNTIANKISKMINSDKIPAKILWILPERVAKEPNS